MRPEKQAMVDELAAMVGGSAFLLIAEYRGMSAEQLNGLRASLRRAGARLLVAKNRLVRQVVRARGWENIVPLLQGQTAMVTGTDIVETAKILKQFGTEGRTPAVKGGVMGTMYLDAEQVVRLAELPSREVLLGQLVGTVAAPLTRLTGVLRQKVVSLVYVLRAVRDKRATEEGRS